MFARRSALCLSHLGVLRSELVEFLSSDEHHALFSEDGLLQVRSVLNGA
jgi:hypothetical protein